MVDTRCATLEWNLPADKNESVYWLTADVRKMILRKTFNSLVQLMNERIQHSMCATWEIRSDSLRLLNVRLQNGNHRFHGSLLFVSSLKHYAAGIYWNWRWNCLCQGRLLLNLRSSVMHSAECELRHCPKEAGGWLSNYFMSSEHITLPLKRFEVRKGSSDRNWPERNSRTSKDLVQQSKNFVYF